MSTSLSEQDFIQLNAYLDGELPERERKAFELRLANDAGLQRELEGLSVTVSLLGMAERIPVPRNFTLDPAMYGRPARRSGPSGFWSVLSTAGAALSTLLVGAGLVLALTSKGALTASAPMAAEVLREEEPQLAAPAAAQPFEEPAEEEAVPEEAMEEAPMAMEAAPAEATEAAAAEEEMAAEQAPQAEMAEQGTPIEGGYGGGAPGAPEEEPAPAEEESAADAAAGEVAPSLSPTPSALPTPEFAPTLGADDTGNRAADEGQNGAEAAEAAPGPEIAQQQADTDMTAQAAAQAALAEPGVPATKYKAAPLPITLLVVGGVGLVISLIGLIASRRRR